jgi:hypothetical protein
MEDWMNTSADLDALERKINFASADNGSSISRATRQYRRHCTDYPPGLHVRFTLLLIFILQFCTVL